MCLSDDVIRRGLQYAQRRTPGIWTYDIDGYITAASADSDSYEVASVTERYTDEETLYDSIFIVEAVNLYPLALTELQHRRKRERSPKRTSAEDLRADLRQILQNAIDEDRPIDPRDLFALAEMPIVEASNSQPVRCSTCNQYHYQAIETRAIRISGPVVICECSVDRNETTKSSEPN